MVDWQRGSNNTWASKIRTLPFPIQAFEEIDIRLLPFHRSDLSFQRKQLLHAKEEAATPALKFFESFQFILLISHTVTHFIRKSFKYKDVMLPKYLQKSPIDLREMGFFIIVKEVKNTFSSYLLAADNSKQSAVILITLCGHFCSVLKCL